MITIEAYRAKIGCFISTARNNDKQKLLKTHRIPRTVGYKDGSLFFFLQTFIVFVFIITMQLNISMAFFKLMLLMDGDIEMNPGPDTYKIQKSVSGSFHQAHTKFGNSAGIQCSCNALYAIFFSIIKNVSVWKSWDLDYILEHGDSLYKIVGIHMNELPSIIEIENNDVSRDVRHLQWTFRENIPLYRTHVM